MTAHDLQSGRMARLMQIEGRVQGVGFRWAMTREALRLGVTGWVRNRLDGRVEALAAGNESAVLRLIEWARCGPPGARVDRITVEYADPAPAAAADFVQLATA